ncbi:MAG: outer-membrane lipoprotein carrier protein LolA [Deltaproteobacteria bacterium]|nr:outer-membrane lipoprotein carrier protein LolA [Deltaproteobacteria bacterium]
MARFFCIVFVVYCFAEFSQPQFECEKIVKDSAKMEELKKFIKSVNSFTSKFEQISFSSSSGQVDVGRGRLFGRKPRNIRIEYESPEIALYVLSANKAYSLNVSTGVKEFFKIDQNDLEKFPVNLLVGGELQKDLIFQGVCQNIYGLLFSFAKTVDSKEEYKLRILVNDAFSSVLGIRFDDFGGVVNAFLLDDFKTGVSFYSDFFKVE